MTRLSAAQETALRRTAPSFNGDAVGSNVKLPKTAELVAQQLRRQIVRGELREGDTLPSETLLMEAFGVSRPTLREAYRVLESENLISVKRGARGGARVHAPQDGVVARYAGLVLEHRGATLADVYEARRVLEAEATRHLAAHRTKADIVALRMRQDELAETFIGDPITWASNALSFHQLVVELAGNQTLSVLNAVICSLIARANAGWTIARLGSEPLQRRIDDTQSQHQRLIEFIEAKDVDAAVDWWRHHCDAIANAVVGDGGSTTVLDLLPAT